MSKNCGFRYCTGMDACFLAKTSPCRHVRQTPPDAMATDEARKSRVVSRIGFVEPIAYEEEARA